MSIEDAWDAIVQMFGRECVILVTVENQHFHWAVNLRSCNFLLYIYLNWAWMNISTYFQMTWIETSNLFALLWLHFKRFRWEFSHDSSPPIELKWKLQPKKKKKNRKRTQIETSTCLIVTCASIHTQPFSLSSLSLADLRSTLPLLLVHLRLTCYIKRLVWSSVWDYRLTVLVLVNQSCYTLITLDHG